MVLASEFRARTWTVVAIPCPEELLLLRSGFRVQGLGCRVQGSGSRNLDCGSDSFAGGGRIVQDFPEDVMQDWGL